MNATTRPEKRRHKAAPRGPRLMARVVLAGLAALGPVGCSVPSLRMGHPNANPVAVAAMTDPGATKTEFHREVSAGQQFNVHVEMARAYESQGDNEAALAEYGKASEACERKRAARGDSKLGPAEHALAQRRMAAVLDRMGRFAQAETHYQKALKLSPDDPKVWNDAGYSYYLQGRWADAERSLKTASSLDPNNPRVLTNLGLTLAAQGKDSEALAALSKAGGPSVGHANMGYILAAQGKTEQARRHYQSALELQPQLNAARQAIARLDAPPGPRPTAVASAAPVRGATKDARVLQTSSVALPPLPPPFIRKPAAVPAQP